MTKFKNFYPFLGILTLSIFLILISFAFPNIIEQTNKPTFCIKCHMMKSQYFSQIKRGIA